MELKDNLKYTKDHEWVLVEEKQATIGITEFAQSELGDLVFVDLPQAGKKLNKGDVVCVVESTKAASDVYSPISGTVAEINSDLQSTPELVNKDPCGKGWLVKLADIDESQISTLMSAEEYRGLINK